MLELDEGVVEVGVGGSEVELEDVEVGAGVEELDVVITNVDVDVGVEVGEFEPLEVDEEESSDDESPDAETDVCRFSKMASSSFAATAVT